MNKGRNFSEKHFANLRNSQMIWELTSPEAKFKQEKSS